MSSVCEDCPCDLITSQRSHFQIPALWGLGFIVNWGGRGRGGVHDGTVRVSVPEPEVVVEERAMGRNGGV